jgi:hypothetical protein
MIPRFRVFVLLVSFASIALADDFKTIDGKEYKNAKVNRVEPDGIVINFSGGIVKIPFTELSPEIQMKYGYDSQAAGAYSAKQREQQAALAQQRQAEEQKRTEEREKYWSEHSAPRPQRKESSSATALSGGALDRPAYGQSAGSISPQTLAAEYAASEVKADNRYKGRIFTVSGTIKSIFRSGGEVIVELKVPYYRTGTVSWMNCIFNDFSGLEQKMAGNAITLTGTVAGMRGNALTMEDCHL